jgi:hypothetical protein
MSNICPGFGLFIGEDVTKVTFLCEYTGEIITVAVGERWGVLADIMESNYLYNLNENKNIDAK